MNVNRNVITWGVIIALIILGGVISVVRPNASGQSTGVEQTTASTGGGISAPTINTDFKSVDISIPNPISGTSIDFALMDWQILLILTIVVPGLVIVPGILLFFGYRALDGATLAVKGDDEYKASVAAIESRQKAMVKAFQKSQPPGPIPSHDESRWTATSTALTIGFLFSLVGAAFSDNFAGGANQGSTAWWFAGVGLLLGFLTLNYNRVKNSDETQGSPIDWGTIFIVMTGIVVVGLGVGVMMWVRSQV